MKPIYEKEVLKNFKIAVLVLHIGKKWVKVSSDVSV